MKKPLGKKMECFRQYDEVLFNQLEKKFLDLETANERLRIIAENYNWQFENISDVVIMIGSDFNILSISPSVEKILGYKTKDFIGRPVSDLRQIFTSESFERAITHISKMLKGEKIPAKKYDFVAKDGTIKHVEIQGSPLISDGQVTGMISVTRDITERVEAEFQREAALEALKESEKKYRRIAENMSDMVSDIDAEGFFTYASPSQQRILGYRPEDLLGTVSFYRIHPDDMDQVWSVYMQAVTTKTDSEAEYRFQHADGHYVWLHSSGHIILDGAGEFAGAIINSIDISKRKLMEEALRESEENYRHLYNNVPAAIYKIDFKNQKLFEVNDVFYKYLGFSKEEITSLSPYGLLTEESRKLFIERVEKMARGIEMPMTVEYEIFNKKGDRLWMRLDNNYIYDTEGQVIAANVVAHDITEQKKAEDLLQDLSSRHEAILAAIPEIIVEVDNNKIYTWANPSAFQFFGEDMIGKEASLYFEGEHDIYDKVRPLFNGAENVIYLESWQRRKDGEKRLLAWWCRVLKDNRGRVTGALSTARDVTERKLAEEKIRASLREKEILISEIHHRVKNNLQLISSLLGLQAKSSGNPELTEMLNGIQGRIQSMAMIHEKLYDTSDLISIDLSSYVKALSQSLFNTLNINPGKIDLTIQTDGGIYVDITKAIPCGLVLNELISNALKHAYPGGRKGNLQIIISETTNAKIDIVVCDNGVGLPDNIDILKPETLGLELVNGLVKNQLNGQIEVKRDNGTKMRLKFPI